MYENYVTKFVNDIVPNYSEENNYPRLGYLPQEISDKIIDFVITSGKDFDEVTKIISFTESFAIKETIKKTYQAMEGFIHNLNTMHSRAGVTQCSL